MYDTTAGDKTVTVFYSGESEELINTFVANADDSVCNVYQNLLGNICKRRQFRYAVSVYRYVKMFSYIYGLKGSYKKVYHTEYCFGQDKQLQKMKRGIDNESVNRMLKEEHKISIEKEIKIWLM